MFSVGRLTLPPERRSPTRQELSIHRKHAGLEIGAPSLSPSRGAVSRDAPVRCARQLLLSKKKSLHGLPTGVSLRLRMSGQFVADVLMHLWRAGVQVRQPVSRSAAPLGKAVATPPPPPRCSGGIVQLPASRLQTVQRTFDPQPRLLHHMRLFRLGKPKQEFCGAKAPRGVSERARANQ